MFFHSFIEAVENGVSMSLIDMVDVVFKFPDGKTETYTLNKNDVYGNTPIYQEIVKIATQNDGVLATVKARSDNGN